MSEGVSLYFHIPFCTKKCPYCHFYVLPDKDPFKKQLLEGIFLEWKKWEETLSKHQLISIYFGGGTPALLGPEPMAQILEKIQHTFSYDPSAEITLEANPENITYELMKGYRDIGINRVSIGVQTLDEQLLKTLGRTHSSQKAKEAIHLTAESGISNISMDLMYDLPGQSLAAWESTLQQVGSLPVTHLSLYNLTIEPHTVFFKYREKLQTEIPDEETSLKMYEMAVNSLQKDGLQQYEISAFSKPSFFSRHNTGYWTGRPFIGFGPSAFSFWEGKRFRNVANLNRYTKTLESGESPIDFEEKLAHPHKERELLAIQLRLMEGVNLTTFQEKNKLDPQTKLSFEKLIAEGYLQLQNSILSLTKKGILFYDSVASEIV